MGLKIQAKTGDELLAFFRVPPLVGVDLDIERDRSPMRDIDFAFSDEEI